MKMTNNSKYSLNPSVINQAIEMNDKTKRNIIYNEIKIKGKFFMLNL